MGANAARERAIADSQFGSGTPATWFIGLSTTPPNNDGTGFTEPVGGGYARVAVTNSRANWPVAATVGGITQNANGVAVLFPNPTGSWGNVGFWGAFLASSGGQPEYSNPIDAVISPKAGNTPVQFDVGDLFNTWA